MESGELGMSEKKLIGRPTREQLQSLSRLVRVIVKGLVIQRGFTESEKRDRNIAELRVHSRRDVATLRLRGRRHEFARNVKLKDYGQSYSFFRIADAADIALSLELIRDAVGNALRRR